MALKVFISYACMAYLNIDKKTESYMMPVSI